MTKLYIAQPMLGRTHEEITAERTLLLEAYKSHNPGKDVELVKSYDPCLKGQSPVYSLGFSVQMLAQADHVLFAPNWELARGCRIEHQVCESYDIPHTDLKDFPGKD